MLSLATSVWEALAEAYDDTRSRVRRRGKAAVLRALRLSVAAAASYEVAHALSPNTIPILAPLTAVLVVQVTLTGTLYSGFERVISVVAGVLLAIIFSAIVGLTWWSLAVLVGVSIIIGQLLKLGPNLVEVPISAMLVLAVGASGAGQAATGRVYETVIGAVVGMAMNIVFPPAVRQLDAGGRVEQFASRVADVLEIAAADLSAGPVAGKAQAWLDETRRLNRHVPAIDEEITSSDESRHLNVRALGTPDVSHSLRDGLEALEHSLVAVRSVFRSVVDGVAAGSVAKVQGEEGARPEDDYTEDVREAFALLLGDLAACIRSYGRLLRAQVEYDAELETSRVEQTLADLREARARVAEMLLLGPREDPQYWELNVTLLATVERVLRELDIEDYARERAAYLAEHDVGIVHTSHEAAKRLRRQARKL